MKIIIGNIMIFFYNQNMEFKEHLKKYLSDFEIEKLIASLNENEVKHAILLNEEKMTKEEFVNLFPNVKPHPLVPNVFLYNIEEYPFGKMYYHDLGVYYLFEPCSSLVSHYLSPNRNDIVLDIAAAPGGKSIHASLLMNNEGILISNEIQTSRSHILSSNIERMGRRNTIVTNNDLDAFIPKYEGVFSKIILDAPCSGSGMFRKQESMKEDWTYNKVLSLSSLQKELILKAYTLLRPGGTLVYSTCSFSYEEDEEVIKHLLSNTDATLVPLPDLDCFYKSKDNIGIHLFPYLFDGEGHYLALIKKPGELSLNDNKFIQDRNKNIHSLINDQTGYIYENNGTFYQMPYSFDIKGLHIIRGGIKLGTLEKYGFNFDHALSHASKSFPLICEIDEDNLHKYLKGEQLSIGIKDGFYLLTYNNIGVGFAKATKGKLNNRYPKGLRR